MGLSSSPKPESKIPPFLYYTGIPASWFQWRFKLPSRNWLIFLSTSGSLVGLYAYDRWKCKQIRNEYVNKVKYLADQSLSTTALPRRVTVYGAKWPDDEDADVTLKYFRRYIKPILNAAAVDYQMVNGRYQGDLADKICESIKEKRRINLGIDPKPSFPEQTLHEQRQREIDDAIIIMGRQTLKEFMNGLKRGWTEPPFKIDLEEQLAHELEADGIFDENNLEDSTVEPNQSSYITTAFNTPYSSQYPSSLSLSRSPAPAEQNSFQDKSEYTDTPLAIPQYPPLLFVPFVDLIGFKHIPRMIWNFFNRRSDVKLGGEAAHQLITGTPRPIRGPDTATSEAGTVENSPFSDISFGVEAESFYKSKPPSVEIEKARKSYYKHLPEKISIARKLASGEREPTKDERNFPPPTEVELRAERMKKEKRWRSSLAGWDIIKPSTPVAWDPRFYSALVVYPLTQDDK